MARRRHSRGTTLLEILMAVGFLAVCAGVTLQVVTVADSQAAYALRRARILARLQDEMEQVRALVESKGLTSGTTNGALTVPGLVEPIGIVRTATLRPASRTLFDVEIAATWSENTNGRTWSDSAKLVSVVRQ